MITCDTHALVFFALEPGRLSTRAAAEMDRGRREFSLACADIVLWEIAMLAERGRIQVPLEPEQFLKNLILGLRLTIFPITPAIATLAQSNVFPHKDPSDRLIGATALHLDMGLLSADRFLQKVPGLKVIW